MIVAYDQQNIAYDLQIFNSVERNTKRYNHFASVTVCMEMKRGKVPVLIKGGRKKKKTQNSTQDMTTSF